LDPNKTTAKKVGVFQYCIAFTSNTYQHAIAYLFPIFAISFSVSQQGEHCGGAGRVPAEEDSSV
jgi:hypothetical protein